MKKSRILTLVFTTLTLLSLLSVSTAFAAPPSGFTFHDEGSFLIDCGSFHINEAYFLDGKVTDFFDKAGNPIRELVQVDENRILTNLATGFTVNGPGHFSFTTNLQTGAIQQNGLVIRINVPGKGVIVLGAGTLRLDGDGNVTFVAGPHQPFFDGDAVTCAALS
jgi:hypothetical protein